MSDVATAPVAEPIAPVAADPVAPAADPAIAAPVAADPAAPVAPTPDAAATPEADAPVGAPETYADFTFPEGMEVDPAALEVFLTLAKELNLTQDQAQKLVGIQTDQIQAQEHAQQERWAATQDEWRGATRADPEIGGANLNQSLAHVNTFLSKFGTPELRELMDTSGMGNRVEVIRMLAAAGKAMGEDSLVSGGTTPPARTLEQRLLPNQAV